MKIKVSIALEKDLVARIDRVAEQLGANRSGLVQKWLERHIDEAELLAGLHGADAARLFYENPELKDDLLEAIRKSEADAKPPKQRRRR